MCDISFNAKAKTIKDSRWVEGYYFKADRHWNKFGIHKDWILE